MNALELVSRTIQCTPIAIGRVPTPDCRVRTIFWCDWCHATFGVNFGERRPCPLREALAKTTVSS